MSAIPKTFDFYQCLNGVSDVMIRAARALAPLDESVGVLQALEEEADVLVHETMEQLNRTYITPFAREDIHVLVTGLDEVIDMLYAAANRIQIYQVKQMPETVRALAKTIVQGADVLAQCVNLLSRETARDQVVQLCLQVNAIENLGDEQLRAGLRELFAHQKDPIELIKIKEILETLETVTDKEEEAAQIIRSIVMKQL